MGIMMGRFKYSFYFRIETKSGAVKKAVADAVSAIKKDLSKISALVKK